MRTAKDSPEGIILAARTKEVMEWVGCRVLLCSTDLNITFRSGVLEVVNGSGPFGHDQVRVVFGDMEWRVGPELLTLPNDYSNRVLMSFIPGIFSDAYIHVPIILEVMRQ